MAVHGLSDFPFGDAVFGGEGDWVIHSSPKGSNDFSDFVLIKLPIGTRFGLNTVCIEDVFRSNAGEIATYLTDMLTSGMFETTFE